MRKSQLKLMTSGVVREKGRNREIIVGFSPANPTILTVRAKGMHQAYPVDLAGLYRWAVAGHVESVRREKKRAKNCA